MSSAQRNLEMKVQKVAIRNVEAVGPTTFWVWMVPYIWGHQISVGEQSERQSTGKEQRRRGILAGILEPVVS